MMAARGSKTWKKMTALTLSKTSPEPVSLEGSGGENLLLERLVRQREIVSA
jgi:hypothetical protein